MAMIFELESWFYEVESSQKVILQVDKREYFSYIYVPIILELTTIFFFILLAIFSSYPDMKWELDVYFDVSRRCCYPF